MQINQNIKVFLALSPDEETEQREAIKSILLKAGIEVFPKSEFTSEEETLFSINESLDNADCSVHIIGSKYGNCLKNDNTTSFAKHQFHEAKKRLSRGDNSFKMFIWYPPDIIGMAKEIMQEQFINEIRYSIIENMIFTNVASPIQLVDDIRSMMTTEEKEKFDINATDVFLMFNEMDEEMADEIRDMLADIVSIEKLNIIQDSDTDYSELCSQQIGKSKLAVVYFKETASWALPFVQQVWKKVGGASSHTPILLIGDEDPNTNRKTVFKAPKVISLIVAGELIPLEIKVQLDKVADILI